MFASKSRFFAYSVVTIFFLFGCSVLKAGAKTIVVGEASDTVSIPGILNNSAITGAASYWSLSGSNLFASSTSYNVGIGTTAPAAGLKLSVNGNLSSSGVVSFTGVTYAGGGNRVLTVDNAGVLNAAALPTDIYWTGTATNLNATTGRTSLGLGSVATLNTVTSAYIRDATIVDADISAGANIASTKIQNGTYFITSAGTSGQVWTSDGDGPGYWNVPSASGLTGSGSTNSIPKWTSGSALGNSSIYDNGTNIGIGTTNPVVKLGIASTGEFLRMIETAASAANYQSWYKNTGARRGYFGFPTASSNVIELKNEASGNIGLTAAYIGIGTTAPGAKLDVSGAIRGTSITDSSLTGVSGGIVSVDASGTLTSSAVPGTNGNTIRSNGTSWVANNNLYNNGTNVGIGTTTPGTYRLKVSGDVAANSFIYNSDRKLKDNIADLDDPLGKIMALRGVSFTWKENGRKSLGLIAQEVEQVYPELVTESNDIKAVQYGNLVAPLIEAVKAQQHQIESLEKRISELENSGK